jgi:hypothetical protein
LATLLSTFDPILLGEMNSVALLDRFEVKYVMHLNSLAPILNRLGETYSVLTIAGQRLSRYRTLYFDTDDFALYLRHHMGARNRYKVRAREYVESHATFLEVKHKTNKQRTTKHRIPTPELVTTLQSSEQFLATSCPFAAEDLVPCLWNSYTRITLVNQAQRERVTLDIDLGFSWEEQQVSLPGVVIAEVKQQNRSCTSDFTTLLREQHIRRAGFSKYCVGVSLINPQMKHNKFKAIHRFIARLAHGEQHDLC